MKIIIPAQYMIINDFLPKEINRSIFHFINQNQHLYLERGTAPDFPAQKGYAADKGFEQWQELIINEIRSRLQVVTKTLSVNLNVGNVECHVSAHLNKGFLGIHNDIFCMPTRVFTYVYYLHCLPCKFSGGQLRIYDAQIDDFTLKTEKAGSCHHIEPKNNSCVFFGSPFYHEVLPVTCEHFMDGRFSFNGWVQSS